MCFKELLTAPTIDLEIRRLSRNRSQNVTSESNDKLVTFIRYENYNTHANTKEGGADGLLSSNPEYNRTEITMGVGYKVADGAVFKADYQLKTTEANDNYIGTINLGIGWWF